MNIVWLCDYNKRILDQLQVENINIILKDVINAKDW